MCYEYVSLLPREKAYVSVVLDPHEQLSRAAWARKEWLLTRPPPNFAPLARFSQPAQLLDPMDNLCRYFGRVPTVQHLSTLSPSPNLLR
jgi:hypothetical protein